MRQRDRETGRQGDRDRETGDRKRFRREAHTHPLTNLSVVRSVLLDLARYSYAGGSLLLDYYTYVP